MFTKYDQYLSSDFSVDFWSDEGISRAASFVSNFDDADWASLYQSIASKSSQWLVRCAETLGDIVDKKSFDALLLLIQIEDKEVQLASIDSINSLASMGFDISQHSKSIEPVLSKLKANSGRLAKLVISSLEAKVAD